MRPALAVIPRRALAAGAPPARRPSLVPQARPLGTLRRARSAAPLRPSPRLSAPVLPRNPFLSKPRMSLSAAPAALPMPASVAVGIPPEGPVARAVHSDAHSTPPSPSGNEHDEKTGKKATMGELVARYGVIATITYLVLSQTIFWTMYLALRLSGLDTQTVLSSLPESWVAWATGHPADSAEPPKPKLPSVLTDYVDPTVFGVVFVVSKLLVPAKLAAVVWLTPRVARVWWRMGWVRPPQGVKVAVPVAAAVEGGKEVAVDVKEE